MMSISAVTFNVAMLATYGYFTYNSCKKNVEETRVEKKKKIDETNSPGYPHCLEKVKHAMKSLTGNEYTISLYFNHNRKVPTIIPAVQMLSAKEIAINYSFYIIDLQACRFLVRNKINYCEYKENHSLKRLLLLSTNQVAIGLFAYYKNISFLKTVALTCLINIPLLVVSEKSKSKKLDSKILGQSTDEELLGGRRFFMALLYNYRGQPICKQLRKCIEKIDQLIKVRNICINPRVEREKERSLNEYLTPFYKKIVQLEFA